MWNDIPGVKLCKTLGPTILKQVSSRLEQHPDTEWWRRLFDKVRMSDFLTGQTNGSKGTFRATLDWVTGPKNLDKILAGNYDTLPNGTATNQNGKPVLCSLSTKRNGRIAACVNPVSPQPGVNKPRRICAVHLTEEEARRMAINNAHNATEMTP